MALDLHQAWGDFVDEIGKRKGSWDWYATLTFRDRTLEEIARGFTKVGMGYARRACNSFINEVGDRLGLRNLFWFRAAEYQKERGVPHYHMLLGGVDSLRRDEAWNWWFKRYGFARILPYEAEKGARFYLCKYVTKELGDVEFSDNLVPSPAVSSYVNYGGVLKRY